MSTSAECDGNPKPLSTEVTSDLRWKPVEQASVRGVSTDSPGTADYVDFVGGNGVDMTHRFDIIKNIIAGALPATYYF